VSLPFYVPPEQVAHDKAEFARKGIARGKSIVVLEYEGGIALMAENPSSLSKIGEIYDRIGFAGVGKFSEFDALRKQGVRFADMRGYAYSREDVQAKALANWYSQGIGEEFARAMKPLEVEVLVAEVGDERLAGHEANSIYRVSFDGSISDHRSHCVIGGSVENLERHLQASYRPGLPLGEALALGKSTLERVENGAPQLTVENLEICLLERSRPSRKFRRLSADEVRGMLGN
jgi:proteasome alpha subunit